MVLANAQRWETLQTAGTTAAANELRPLLAQAELVLRARLWALFGDARSKTAPTALKNEEHTQEHLSAEHKRRLDVYVLRHLSEPLTAFTLDDKIALLKRSCLMGYGSSSSSSGGGARFKDCSCSPGWYELLGTGHRFPENTLQQFNTALEAKDITLLAPPQKLAPIALFPAVPVVAAARAPARAGGGGGGGGEGQRVGGEKRARGLE